MRKHYMPNGSFLNVMEKGETLNPNGRPPKRLTKVLKELKEAGYERVSAAMVLEAYELLLGLNVAKIKEIIYDDAQPSSMRIVGRAMLSDKGAEMLEKMLDRAHGKPKQIQEITGADGEPLFNARAQLQTLEANVNNLLNDTTTKGQGDSEADSQNILQG